MNLRWWNDLVLVLGTIEFRMHNLFVFCWRPAESKCLVWMGERESEVSEVSDCYNSSLNYCGCVFVSTNY